MRVLVLVAIATLAIVGCSAVDRSTVAWSDLEVSDDRRTLTVTTYYGRTCHKQPDGVDVEVRDDEIVVSAWLADSSGPDGVCTTECSSVTQTVTLDEPLPDDRPFGPPADHVLGCGM